MIVRHAGSIENADKCSGFNHARRPYAVGVNLDKPGFSLVSYACSTCIGNSGPLPPAISAAVNEKDLSVVSALRSLREPAG